MSSIVIIIFIAILLIFAVMAGLVVFLNKYEMQDIPFDIDKTSR